jgi:hypothetical protein
MTPKSWYEHARAAIRRENKKPVVYTLRDKAPETQSPSERYLNKVRENDHA